MTTDKNNSPVTAPMWWDGGDRAITAREKATIEEHGPSCFSIGLVPATPSARWAADGLRDPHAGRYACERAALTLGNLTDDELANAVYLHGNEQPSMADLVAGKALSGIVYLTAAKERIRWLSRALTGATAPQPEELAEQQGDALIDTALGYLSTALDDLDSCPDRRPGIMVTEAMHTLREAFAARQPGAQEPVDAIERIARLLYLRSCNRYSDGTPFTDWEGLADNLKDYSRDEARKYEALRNTALWPAGRENYTPSEAIR
jgi:hypothetical protein